MSGKCRVLNPEGYPPKVSARGMAPSLDRLEGKKAVRRVRKIGNADIFEPVIARDVARHRLLDEILSFFGGRAQPMMAQLAEYGKLTIDDVRELEKTIRKRDQEQKAAKADKKRSAK